MENAKFKVTLTIWTGSSDEVDKAALEQFVETVGREKVYLDVPWAHGDSGAGGSRGAQALLIVLLCLAVWVH